MAVVEQDDEEVMIQNIMTVKTVLSVGNRARIKSGNYIF